MVRREYQNMSYYGLITDIIELRYTKGNSVVLFKCDWYDVAREGIGYKLDCHGITSINRTRKLNTQEPFVLASQAIQVYYVNCIKDLAWSVVIESQEIFMTCPQMKKSLIKKKRFKDSIHM